MGFRSVKIIIIAKNIAASGSQRKGDRETGRVGVGAVVGIGGYPWWRFARERL